MSVIGHKRTSIYKIKRKPQRRRDTEKSFFVVSSAAGAVNKNKLCVSAPLRFSLDLVYRCPLMADNSQSSG